MTLTERSSSIKLLVGIGFGMFLGVLSANSIPVMIGVLIDDLSMSEAEVGVLGTIELLAVALAALAATPLAGKVSNRRLALCGCLLAIIAQFLSAAVDSLYLLAGLRFIAGAGLGLAYAAAAMAAAAAANPDRVLGYGVTAGLLALVVLLPGLVKVITAAGYKGGYVALGVLVIFLLPVMGWLDRGTLRPQEPGRAPALPERPLVGLLLCIALFNIGSGAIWSFSERIGQQAGLSLEETGFIIAAGAFSGVAGSLFAGWLGDRWGRRRPVLTALVVAGLGYMILAGAADRASYITGVNLYWVTYMFLLPLMIGAGAAMDAGGRAATLAAGTISLTFALGPACGGYIATWFSYAAIGWFSCALCLLAALAFVLVKPADTMPRLAG